MDDLEAVTAESRKLTHPNRRPEDAATLILVDRAGTTPKVLLGKRHHQHTFMPGKYVFPGGRVEPQDRAVAVATPLNPLVETRLMRNVIRPSPRKAQAFALTAIRETFEETGLLIGAPCDEPPPMPPGPWRDFARCGYAPDLSALHLVARAIAPPRNPRRFDARFFTVDAGAIAHRVDGAVHNDAELVELRWLPIRRALELDLPDITRIVLKEIELRIAAGFRHELPVPLFRMRHSRFVRELL
jgi:8-oxo-dGTP pyrophosphatase MutT (NUDIX family)